MTLGGVYTRDLRGQLFDLVHSATQKSGGGQAKIQEVTGGSFVEWVQQHGLLEHLTSLHRIAGRSEGTSHLRSPATDATQPMERSCVVGSWACFCPVSVACRNVVRQRQFQSLQDRYSGLSGQPN